MDTLLQLDQIDRHILDCLQARAKITNAQLAHVVGLSPASTLERVRKLEHQGIIKGYHAKLDPQKLSLDTCVMIQITLQPLNKESVTAFKETIKQIPEVIACYQVVGNADFWAQIVTKNMAAYQQLVIHRLSEVKEIQQIKSFVITDTIKETAIPVMPRLSTA